MEIIITFGAGILLGFSYIVNRQISLTKFHPATLTFSYSLIGMVISAPLLFYEAIFAKSSFVWILAVISPLIFALANYSGFSAYRSLEASVVSLISRFSLVVATLLALIFLQEHLTFMSIFGLICVLTGSMVLIFEKTRFVINRGIFFALLMASCYGIVAVLDRVVLNEFSPFTYVFVNNLIITLVLLPQKGLRQDVVILVRKQPVLTLASALCGLLSWVAFLVAIRSGDLIRLYPIWESMALITTVVVGIIILKEIDKLNQKIFGTLVTILGIMLLS